ncbi:MAG: hypothetical protein M1831_004377 [Alyxoria varia]|nr:MAG: hypothetical protein M1831_004377 [Alyxoria varia]
MPPSANSSIAAASAALQQNNKTASSDSNNDNSIALSSSGAVSSRVNAINEAETGGEAATALSIAVDALLEDVKKRFEGVGGEMFARMDEMARRLDDLEASLRQRESSGSAGSGTDMKKEPGI